MDQRRKKVFKTDTDRVRWLSEFLITDVGKLNSPDFLKINSQAWAFLLGEGNISYQLFPAMDYIEDTEENRQMLKRLQQLVKEELCSIVNLRDNGTTLKELLPIRDKDYQYNLRYNLILYDDRLFMKPSMDTGLIVFNLIRLIQNYPLSSIKQCRNEKCQNYFVQSTKREKIYCSQRCAWQQTAREARKVDREGYNRKQARLMRERYRDAQRKRLGKNVKVGRKEGKKEKGD